jgi:cyclin H
MISNSKSSQPMSDMSKSELDQLSEQLLAHVRASRLTDAELLYTPSQISLACVSIVSPNMASEWAEAKGSEAVLGVIETVKAMLLEQSAPPDVELVREVDRRLKICKNPEKVVGSKAYLAKQAAEEKASTDKRVKKADSIRQAIEGGDPFGSELGAMVDDDDD